MPRPNRKLADKIEADVFAAKQRAASSAVLHERSAHLVGGLYSVLAHAIAELRTGTYDPAEIDRLSEAFLALTDDERDAISRIDPRRQKK